MPISVFILSCFFLSGAAGLIYQVLWVRMIDKVMGSAPFAVATVLAVFMGGLALGSYVAGRGIDRIDRKEGLLALYGKLEIGIGIYGLLLPVFIVMVKPLYALAYNHLFQWFWIYTGLSFFGCALLLVLPTSLMGATLPILCRFYVAHLGHLGGRSGRLYGLNTIGAAVGACLAGFFLIMRLGVWGTLFVAVGINFLVGILCILLSRKGHFTGAAIHEEAPNSEPLVNKNGPSPSVNWALWIFAVSGFCAMAYEVIWTRLLGLIIGPTIYSFTLVVATFIIGLALGSLYFGWLADRIKGTMPLLLATQVAAAILALWVSQFLGNSQFFFAKLIFSFQQDFTLLILLQSLILFLVLLPPTLFLGATFPLVNKVYARSLAHMGRSIGSAYALNTLGAILGSFSAGFLLIPFLGKENGLRMVLGLQAMVAVAAWGAIIWRRRAWPRLAGPLLTMATVVALFVHFPAWDRQLLSYGRYHNFKDMAGSLDRTSWFKALWQGQEILRSQEAGREIVYYGDGIGGFTTVERLTDSMGTVKYTLLNSGKPDASSHGDRATQTLLAHVPLLFHPSPQSVMVLGLASGMTTGEILHYPVARIDVLEINPQVVHACEIFSPWNNNCLKDPRTRVIVQDGRNHLSLTQETYDVIISEPSNPWMAGLANLYTREFFQIVRSRLRDKGIFVQWIHSYEMDWPTFAMVGRTFRQAFPKGFLMTTLTGVGDYLLVGFKGDMGLDPRVAARNFQYARQSQNMSLPNPELLYRLILSEDLEGLFGSGPLHTDDWPRLEFAAPRLLYATDLSIEQRISQRRWLSSQTRAVMAARDPVDALLDILEFSASVQAPLFGIVDPHTLTPGQRARYVTILEGYCDCAFLKGYDAIADPAWKGDCARRQAARIRQHLSLNPQDAPAHYSLGLALRQMGETEGAIEAFKAAISLNPFHAKALNSLGVAYMDKGAPEEGRKAFLKALSLDPAHAKAYFNLARLAVDRNDRNAAIAYLRKGLQYEENPQARQFLQQLRQLNTN